MPEWAEALFALGVTVLAVVAFRFGAATRRSPEGGEVAARFGRLVMQAGVAAGATGAGTFSADREPAGSLPVLGWALLMVAALALTSGFALRLGAGWSSGPPVPLGRRIARYLVTAVIAVGGLWLGDQAADAAPGLRGRRYVHGVLRPPARGKCKLEARYTSRCHRRERAPTSERWRPARGRR